MASQYGDRINSIEATSSPLNLGRTTASEAAATATYDIVPYSKMNSPSRDDYNSNPTAYLDGKFEQIIKELQTMSKAITEGSVGASTPQSPLANLDKQDKDDDRDKTNGLLEKLAGIKDGIDNTVSGIERTAEQNKKTGVLIWALGPIIEKLTGWFAGSKLDDMFSKLFDSVGKLPDLLGGLKNSIDNITQPFKDFADTTKSWTHAFEAWMDRWDTEKGKAESQAAAQELMKDGKFVETDINNIGEATAKHMGTALTTVAGRQELLSKVDLSDKNKLDTYAELTAAAPLAMEMAGIYHGGEDSALSYNVTKTDRKGNVKEITIEAFDANENRIITIKFDSVGQLQMLLAAQGWVVLGNDPAKWTDPFGNTAGSGRLCCQNEIKLPPPSYLLWYQQEGEAAYRLSIAAMQEYSLQTGQDIYDEQGNILGGFDWARMSFEDGKDSWREDARLTDLWRELYANQVSDKVRTQIASEEGYQDARAALLGMIDGTDSEKQKIMSLYDSAIKKALRKNKNSSVSEIISSQFTDEEWNNLTDKEQAAYTNYAMWYQKMHGAETQGSELFKAISGFYDKQGQWNSMSKAYGMKMIYEDGTYKQVLTPDSVWSNNFAGVEYNQVISDYVKGLSNFTDYGSLSDTIYDKFTSQGIDISKAELNKYLDTLDTYRKLAVEEQKAGLTPRYALNENGSLQNFYINASPGSADPAGNTN